VLLTQRGTKIDRVPVFLEHTKRFLKGIVCTAFAQNLNKPGEDANRFRFHHTFDKRARTLMACGLAREHTTAAT